MIDRKISRSLALATCALLGAKANAAGSGGLEISADALLYSEVDRVTVFEPVIKIRKEIGDDEFVSGQLAYDSMSGASANGASATNKPQTFTTPSGEGYVVEANKTPTREFKDTRTAVNLEWEKPLARLFKMVLGGHVSSEEDYFSTGLAATFSLDLNNRLTTLTAGGAYTADTLNPKGGAPVGLELLSAGSGSGEDEGEGTESKNITDVMLGVTQVLTRKTLTQLNFTHSQVEGYQTDPYKIVSVVDGTTGDTLDYRYEKRPTSRSINIVYWKLVHQFNEDVLNFSYRYFTDDWQVKSHTADIKYRYELNGKSYLQPYYRYYKQSAAEFYRHSITDSEPVPDFVSADYRLGEMTSNTIGLKFGTKWGRDGEIAARIGYIRQEGNSSPSDAVGIQKNQDLFPTVEAYIFHISLKKTF